MSNRKRLTGAAKSAAYREAKAFLVAMAILLAFLFSLNFWS